MTSLHLRPVQFVDTPIGHPDGSVARLAGGMQWFAAYEVIEDGRRRAVPVADVAAELIIRVLALVERRDVEARLAAVEAPFTPAAATGTTSASAAWLST